MSVSAPGKVKGNVGPQSEAGEPLSKSLLEQLPGIVTEGKRRAAQILENLEGRNRVTLQTRELVLPNRDTIAEDLFGQFREDDVDRSSPNRLIYGDNLLAMAALLAGDHDHPSMRGKLDLIYIDPPFDSKADYRAKITLPGATIDQKPTVLEQFAYSDTWSDGTASYLAMIAPRLVLMRELLAETGAIYVHLDWHVGHYVKILLDEIFGKENFRNEIVWYYYNKMPDTRNRMFPRSHDVIYSYVKNSTSDYSFKHQEELRDKPVRQLVRKKHEGRMINARDEDGNVMYVDRSHRTVDSVWRIPMLQPADKTQNLSFLTQKPEALIERIINASCPDGGLVADFFVGSGTTVSVAERMGRSWIGADMGKPSTMITRKRLIDQDAKPFLFQAIGDYQVEQAKSVLGRKFKVGELAQVVLRLFGAVPLPPEANPSGAFGRIVEDQTLVIATSPNALVTGATLKRAQGARVSTMGGFDKVVVLGWNFSDSIGQDIDALNDDRLKVLVIPPDLLDRLKKKGSIEKLAEEVRFSTLQYLQASVQGRQQVGESEIVTVALQNYVLLSPDAINLDDKSRDQLLAVMNKEPLALLEYWAVDPDYDGQVFRSVWQDYRGNTENDSDELRVVTIANVEVPYKPSSRTVCVRAVDVFGYESEVIIENVEARV
ncbi:MULTISPECIES: DNA methyltransferase [Micrococcaceae]|uniref:Type III restriction-modification system methylation subunit n=2 Tax=unclassified Arthrobacter TaxID=235627 RepID=I3W1G8_9MICC|nr:MULTISPECIES: DNA methyltransferase [unclassified Arthrobacter]AFK89445.1 Type III restriction-modification system methylation subunit [Arthrobacter sp. J3.40]AFK89595.1 Type III restriction-modification system methylation subunit [Arthrobacter sp. J3.53]